MPVLSGGHLSAYHMYFRFSIPLVSLLINMYIILRNIHVCFIKFIAFLDNDSAGLIYAGRHEIDTGLFNIHYERSRLSF